MVSLTKAIVERTKIPVTVKTRLGWDHDSIQIVDVAERLQDVGAKPFQFMAAQGRRCIKGMPTGTQLQQ